MDKAKVDKMSGMLGIHGGEVGEVNVESSRLASCTS